MEKAKRDLLILLALVGVLIAYLSYQFVFLKFQTKTEAMETANTVLETKITELEALLPKEEEFTAEIESMKTEMAEKLDRFPADFRLEDGYLFAISLGDNTGMSFSQISVGEKEVFYQPGAGTAEDAAAATTAGTETQASTAQADGTAAGTDAAASKAELMMYRVSMGLGFQSTYEGFKNSIDYIRSQPDRRIIDTVSASFDSATGNLTGTMTVNAFTLTGTDKVYEEPVIPNVATGTGNIFGTVEMPAAPIIK